jgi:hypothetical protein
MVPAMAGHHQLQRVSWLPGTRPNSWLFLPMKTSADAAEAVFRREIFPESLSHARFSVDTAQLLFLLFWG